MSESNPQVGGFLRAFTVAVLAVLVIGGVGLFFLGGVVRPVWPWDIPPFNMAFIGAIYLSSIPAFIVFMRSGRWAPARLILPMQAAFTGLALAGTLLHWGSFHPDRPLTWLWLLIYVALPANALVHLWRYRAWPGALASATPPAWRYGLWLQAAVLGAYGLAQFLAPAAASAFWPWKVDDLHGQLYSGAFAALGLGAWLVSRRAAGVEFTILGLSQAAFGLLAAGGLVMVDAGLKRVDWSAPGVWAWLAACAVIAAAGLGLLWRGLRTGPAGA